jgi:hypothetical protein
MGEDKIRITLDDLARIKPPAAAGEPRNYGQIAEQSAPAAPAGRGSIFLQAWFYLGAAGLCGSLIAWAVCEPWFVDGPGQSWANFVIFPLMLVLICVGFGVVEGIVERSPDKATMRGLTSLGLGTVLGFVFFFIANLIFTIGVGILAEAGALNVKHVGFWLTRAIAWMGFGVAGGVVYGIVGQAGKKCLYGIAGGVLGAGIGGFVFDPISFIAGGAAASRAVGMAIFGLTTGVAMGLVESALKDRWLYVSAGPLAGKQFILYKPVTTIGSDQSCDIYLFKDPAVLPRHAVITLNGPRMTVSAAGPVYVRGRAVHETVLASGDNLQIGRYAFLYRDRERTDR